MTSLHEMYDNAEDLKAQGKHEEAIAGHLAVLEQDENYCLTHHALAVLYGMVGKHDEAVKHGERACELEPSDPFSFTAMSMVYVRAFQGTQDPKYIQLAEDAKAKSHMLSGH